MRPSERIIAHILASLMSRISQERRGSTVLPLEVSVTVREAPGQPGFTLLTVSIGKDLREPCMRALREAGATGVTDYKVSDSYIGVTGHFPATAPGAR